MSEELYTLYDPDTELYLSYELKPNVFSWGDYCPNSVFTLDFILTKFKNVVRNLDLAEHFVIVPVESGCINFFKAVYLDQVLDKEEVMRGLINYMSVPVSRVSEDEEFKNGFWG